MGPDAIVFQLVALGKILFAMALGAVIGIEREMGDKPAGLRTHILVSGAACSFLVIGPLLIRYYAEDFGLQTVAADPIRHIQAIVLGIAFLGAGTIIHDRGEQVKGLTTAASLLISTAIGMVVALDQYILGVGLAVSGFLVLRVLGNVEFRRFKTKPGDRQDRKD